MKKITLLVPCYNEEEVIETFITEAKKAIKNLNYNWEFLFVNDGSKDKTQEILEKLNKEDNSISIIEFSRNFGKEIALFAGLQHAKGDAVIILDADLQDPPELIEQFIKYWEEGYQDVYAKRAKRKDGILKRLFASVYYSLLSFLSNGLTKSNVGDFRLLDRKVVDALCSIPERLRYTKGMFEWVGFKKKEVLFNRPNRKLGKTKFNFIKLFVLGIDGITSFSIRPLRIASIAGFLSSSIAGIYGTWLIIRKIFFYADLPGYTSLAIFILFIGGLQLLALGILGEYLGRMFLEVKARPQYIINQYIPSKD